MLDATGIRIIDGIGATEMLHVFISAADDDIRPGSTGRAVPGYRAAILDADGAPVADGTPGRLAVIGPTGCRYLFGDRQADYVQHGWNITGDTYVRDAEGCFWYRARSDDMIVSSGYNIAGPEVEGALERHPDVVECAVVGMPDAARGQIVHAAVVLRDGVVGDEERGDRAPGLRQGDPRAVQVPAQHRVPSTSYPYADRASCSASSCASSGPSSGEFPCRSFDARRTQAIPGWTRTGRARCASRWSAGAPAVCTSPH